jgi:hypothetical protein
MSPEGASPAARQSCLPHRQIQLQAAGQAAWVDEGLVPLLRELWHRRIRTLSSCQGVSGIQPAYLSMPSWAAEQFLALVVAAGGELAFRAYRAPPARSSITELLRDIHHDEGFFNEMNAYQDPTMWRWTAAPRWDSAEPSGLQITAFFPPDDLKVLTAGIRKLTHHHPSGDRR